MKIPKHFKGKYYIAKWGGSIRLNPEGQIIENRKAKFYEPLGQNRKAEFDRKSENISSLIYA